MTIHILILSRELLKAIDEQYARNAGLQPESIKEVDRAIALAELRGALKSLLDLYPLSYGNR